MLEKDQHLSRLDLTYKNGITVKVYSLKRMTEDEKDMICYVCGKPFKGILQHGIGLIYLCDDHAMKVEGYIEKMNEEENQD